jgi:hypothetical protein
MIYERYVPSFRCKVSLERSVSMAEIDDLRVVFIDFYVPALTSRLH